MSRPTTRVLALLELLQTHERLSGAELARRLAVDIRTVRRYIGALEDLGIPVTTEQGRYGGYMLVAGFKLPPMMFTEEETLAVALGLRAVSQLGLADTTPAVTSVQAKLERVMPDKLKRRVRAIGESIDIVLPRSEHSENPELLMSLSEAAASRLSVELSYQSEQKELTRRCLDPYGLVYRRGRWYVCGFCHLREELRTFRLDRVQQWQVLDRQFQRPADFNSAAYLRQSLMTARRGHPLGVILHTDVANASQWMDGIELLIEQREDGLFLHTSTDSYPCFARWLAFLPFPFTIVEPPELKQAVRKEAERLLAASEASSDAAANSAATLE